MAVTALKKVFMFIIPVQSLSPPLSSLWRIIKGQKKMTFRRILAVSLFAIFVTGGTAVPVSLDTASFEIGLKTALAKKKDKKAKKGKKAKRDKRGKRKKTAPAISPATTPTKTARMRQRQRKKGIGLIRSGPVVTRPTSSAFCIY